MQSIAVVEIVLDDTSIFDGHQHGRFYPAVVEQQGAIGEANGGRQPREGGLVAPAHNVLGDVVPTGRDTLCHSSDVQVTEVRVTKTRDTSYPTDLQRDIRLTDWRLLSVVS